MNERSALELVRELGPLSRAQIARRSGLSKPTVSQALTALEAAQLVREAGRSSGGVGPAAVLYELNPAAGWVVGIDVGRHWVRAAIADLNGEIAARLDERALARSAPHLISQIGALAHRLADEAGIGWRSVTVATVGSPGVLEPAREQVALAHNLPGWGREGIVRALRDELGTNLTFENDVNLATVGEHWKGIGKGIRDFVYLHVGTGVGMGIVADGRLHRGSRGRAGEIGYLPVATSDPREPTNLRRGALEGSIGATGIVTLARSLGVHPPITPKRVLASARRGDERALRVVDLVAERIALAVATILPILDPELVVIGGGIGRNGDVLLHPVERELASISPFRARIEASMLGEDAELIGAVASALEEARERLFSRVRRHTGAARE
jgi:predicted NBD/HSP70 family sugar kinase